MSAELIKVTLIDDDRDDHALVSGLLDGVAGRPYALTWVTNSEQGGEALAAGGADIYLLDYQLDHKSGLDLLHETAGRGLKRNIILLTGAGNRDVDLAAMEKGAADFLPKANLTSELLERSIRYCLKRSADHERLRETEKLRAEKEIAEEANRAKSALLASVSHEIRNPLGSILGFSDLAARNTTDEKQLRFLLNIKKSGEHLLALVNDLLDLSKAESGHLQVNREYVEWRTLIGEISESLSPKLQEKGISLTVSESSPLPELLLCDPARFRQILLNLLGNALKFTEKGHIRISCARDGARLHLDVSDTGIGIAADEQKNIFKPFRQANAGVCKRYGGTGLGLDLSRQLCRALGGELSLLQSAPGLGSTFRVSLPAEMTSRPAPHVSAAGS